MLLTISQVLDCEQLSSIREKLTQVRWNDGRSTAGATASEVKRNLQADLSSRSGVSLSETIKTALASNRLVQAAIIPRTFSKPLVSKTGVGGGYGLHVDNPFMRHGTDTLRTDVSFTLFLSDPDSYSGGDLVIEDAGMTHTLKANAGDLVIYPSTSLHAVREVESGDRIVCVGWIESWIRSPEDRQTLFDLENLYATLGTKHDAQSLEMLTLSKAIANLKRRFS